MIIIGGGRGEEFVASNTTRGRIEGRDPSFAVFSPDMDDEVHLHPALVCTALGGTRPQRSRSLYGMRLHSVLLQPALLYERLATTWFTTHMRSIPGVFFHMVEHCVLTSLGDPAIGANKGPLWCTNIGHFDAFCLICHYTLAV